MRDWHAFARFFNVWEPRSHWFAIPFGSARFRGTRNLRRVPRAAHLRPAGPASIMPQNQSVTWWIENLKGGDEAAAQSLWQRYFQRLAGLARERLGEGHRRV